MFQYLIELASTASWFLSRKNSSERDSDEHRLLHISSGKFKRTEQKDGWQLRLMANAQAKLEGMSSDDLPTFCLSGSTSASRRAAESQTTGRPRNNSRKKIEKGSAQDKHASPLTVASPIQVEPGSAEMFLSWYRSEQISPPAAVSPSACRRFVAVIVSQGTFAGIPYGVAEVLFMRFSVSFAFRLVVQSIGMPHPRFSRGIVSAVRTVTNFEDGLGGLDARVGLRLFCFNYTIPGLILTTVRY